MAIIFLLIIIPILAITAWVSYYLSASIYRSLKKNDNRYARLIQVAVFLASFALLAFIAFYLVATNVRLGR